MQRKGTQNTNDCGRRSEQWGLISGGCAMLLALFPDTAVCHGPVVIHWYHTWINNMNKTDVIKIGCFPSLLPAPRGGERQQMTPLFFSSSSSFLLLSNCLSDSPPFACLPSARLPPQGCEAWLSTEAELSKLKGGAEEKRRRQTQANKLKAIYICVCVWVWQCVRVFVGQEQLTHSSLLGNMKPDKQRNDVAPYGCSGRGGSGRQRHRGAEWKWKPGGREPRRQGVDCGSVVNLYDEEVWNHASVAGWLVCWE